MGTGELKTEEEVSAKITVTKAAEKAVSEVVLRVNDGFDAGRVNRQDVASWILIKFKETFGNEEIGQIRAIHIDEIAFLESKLRRHTLWWFALCDDRSFLHVDAHQKFRSRIYRMG